MTSRWLSSERPGFNNWSAGILPNVFCIFLVLVIGTILFDSAAATEPHPSRHLDVPFTLEVETPHVAWGKPSALAPVHAFVVPSVSEGRTLVELAQRIEMSFDTVMIDEAWDVNTWTVGADKDYESRNYKLAYEYLDDALSKDRSYDVIVLPSLHGWNRLPAVSRQAILRRVRQGTG